MTVSEKKNAKKRQRHKAIDRIWTEAKMEHVHLFIHVYCTHGSSCIYICKSHDISSDIIDVIWHFIHKSVMRATDIVYIFGVYYIDIRRI